MGRYTQIAVGDQAEIWHTVTAKDVDRFTELTGDNNPLHVSEEFAAKTDLRSPVVHGMLTASFISTLIGTKLPGEGALWYEQNLRFLGPVRVGESIRVVAEVIRKSDGDQLLSLSTIVFGDNDRKVIEGEAKVKVLEVKDKDAELPQQSTKSGAVIVTGGAQGIGAAISRRLAAQGKPVVINYLRSEKAALKIVAEIEADGGRAVVHQADLSHPEEIEGLVRTGLGAYGAISGVVNNASKPIIPAAFAELEWPDFQRHIDVQLKGAFELCRCALPYLSEVPDACIVNIASLFGEGAPPVQIMPYSIAKAALLAFTRALAVELGPKGIRVNSVSPGMTSTAFLDATPEKSKMLAKTQTPLRKLAIPEDIAGAVAYLFSDQAGHVSGENIHVNGGVTMS